MKTRKQRQANQLGMSIGAATSRLRKNLVWKLLLRQGENRCLLCGDWISSPDDFAIGHSEEWFDNDPSLFWDFDNIAFGHLDCVANRAAKRREDSKMQFIKVSIEDENGEWLPAINHKGTIYVVGQDGKRYNLRIKNLTGKRLEIVATVDGRDVISGKVGDVHERGYVIDPHEEFCIKGFRQTDDKVAAFRFGAKKDSYSEQMGTGQHVGVIGIAVFEERESEGLWVPFAWDQVRGGDIHIHQYGKGGIRSVATMDSFSPGSSPASYSVTSCTMGGDIPTAVAASASVEPARETKTSSGLLLGDSVMERSVLRSRRTSSKRSRRGQSATVTPQKLGTEYGESIGSKVGHTSFVRAHSDPCEVYVFEYDSKAGLQRRGIPMKFRRPSREEKNPFPRTPEVDPGYAPAPPLRKHR